MHRCRTGWFSWFINRCLKRFLFTAVLWKCFVKAFLFVACQKWSLTLKFVYKTFAVLGKKEKDLKLYNCNCFHFLFYFLSCPTGLQRWTLFHGWWWWKWWIVWFLVSLQWVLNRKCGSDGQVKPLPVPVSLPVLQLWMQESIFTSSLR